MEARNCVLAQLQSAPDRIRTCDLRFRRPTLYPAELRAPIVEGSGRRSAAPSGQAGTKFPLDARDIVGRAIAERSSKHLTTSPFRTETKGGKARLPGTRSSSAAIADLGSNLLPLWPWSECLPQLSASCTTADG